MTSKDKNIEFYKVRDKYGEFSNFALFPIFIDGEIWLTVEHFFQANKFEDPLIRKMIKSFASPMEAAKEGRNKNSILRKNWENIKEDIMLRGLYAKFLQHHKLKQQLLDTAERKIVEHTSNDNYWGDGGDGSGLNRLGSLLMEVRKKIREINDESQIVLPPWIAFPEVSQYDMFWRMGLGEDYMHTWSKYYLSLSNKEEYHQSFPEPIEWEGFFE